MVNILSFAVQTLRVILRLAEAGIIALVRTARWLLTHAGF